jgi:tRNA threonylcarbamoyladenosine biosynthesis protein TsaE
MMSFFPNGAWCVPAELRIATDVAMRDLGRELAARLRAGDLVIVTGPLGAGKTTLVQGIGQGLGVRGPVTSPTFVIARVHPALAGSGPSLVHADAYRLGSVSEVDDLDLEADMASAVTVVEWGEGLAEGLAADRLEISIQPDPYGEARTVRLRGHGARWHPEFSGKAPASSADRLYSSAVSSVNVRVMQRTRCGCCPCRLHRPLAQAQKACAH